MEVKGGEGDRVTVSLTVVKTTVDKTVRLRNLISVVHHVEKHRGPTCTFYLIFILKLHYSLTLNPEQTMAS